MRALGIIFVALGLAIVVAVWLEQAGSGRGAPALICTVPEIRITGPGNTLASVARTVNNPDQFAYDPATRTAVSHAHLVIEGELLLGRAEDPRLGECLELATEVCGDLRVEVRPGGSLRLHHSQIRTVSQILSSNACSRGYALFVDGELTLDRSRVSYLSGSTSQCLRQGARATIRNSTFSQCDGCALNCVNVDGSRIMIEDSEIIGGGNWGLVVQGFGGAPLVVRNSVLDGQVGAVFLTGENAEVHLVDCTFDTSKVVFNGPTGKAVVAWTRRFQVLEAGTSKPRSDLVVRASSLSDDGEPWSAEGRTNAEGVADLVLAQWVARPGASDAPETRSAPRSYRVLVLGPGGEQVATRPDLPVGQKSADIIVISVGGS